MAAGEMTCCMTALTQTGKDAESLQDTSLNECSVKIFTEHLLAGFVQTQSEETAEEVSGTDSCSGFSC